jgi:hypothetical protein
MLTDPQRQTGTYQAGRPLWRQSRSGPIFWSPAGRSPGCRPLR